MLNQCCVSSLLCRWPANRPGVLQQRRSLGSGADNHALALPFVADDPRYPPAEVSLTEEQLKLV